MPLGATLCDSVGVRPGLRLQILLLLGGLLLLAFVPLFFAVATYARVTLQETRDASSRALGRAIAGHVAEARRDRGDQEIASLLDAEVGVDGALALALYDLRGRVVARAGELTAVDALPVVTEVRHEAVFEVQSRHGRALAVRVPDDRGAVVAVLRVDDQATRISPLIRLFALYTGLVALALLVTAYFALTRLIVRPLDEIGSAAQRVAHGARRFTPPHRAARELAELGASLETMTSRLLEKEEALRLEVARVAAANLELGRAQDGLIRSERLASVGRLAAGLAHEIGNPISALMGLLDLMLEGGLSSEEERDFLVRMRRESERIHHILRDLLAFARPGKAVRDAAEPGLVEVAAHETVALLGPQRAMHDVELVLDLEGDLPRVTLSREHLVQVLLNLVLNAADATGRGGHVTVSARLAGEAVELAVSDDGPGVAPEVVSTLFEPFVTTKEVGKGTGLGLAVCRGLVEAAGGTLRLDPTHSPGARFVMELPTAPRSARSAVPA